MIARAARTKWSTLIAVCGKCSGGPALRRRLRAEAKRSGSRAIRIVKTTCLDVCPKGRVTVSIAGDGARTVVAEHNATLASLDVEGMPRAPSS